MSTSTPSSSRRTRGQTAAPRRRGFRVVTGLVAALALAGCTSPGPSQAEDDPGQTTSGAAAEPAGERAETATYPVTVTSCGREHTYDEAPSRVVLGNYRTLATLGALGVADAVTGYLLGPDDGGVAPTDLPADLEVVSPDTVPAREPVLAAEPDLFLSFNEAQLTGEGTLSYDDLAGIGANAYVLGAYCAQTAQDAGIDTVYEDIENLGAIFGVTDAADDLVSSLRERVTAARDSLDGATATVASLKVLGEQVYAIGGYPASAVLDALGVENQFGDLGMPFAQLSAEQALVMDPDLVLVNYLGDEAAAVAELGAVLPGVPAVQEGRVRGADEDLAQGGGVGVVDLLEAVAADVADVTGDAS